MRDQIKKYVDGVYAAYARANTAAEDAPVLRFLAALPREPLHYLEVGSGLGRFPLLLQKQFPALRLTCLEINKNLRAPKTWRRAKSAGIPTIVGDIIQTDLGEEKYDIVHCSHVIEHFGYPDVTKVLDALLNTVKTGGYLIIRTPLDWSGFYKEIDHIRPYPPESIYNYLNNPQQQKIGSHCVKEVSRWYRRSAAQLYVFNTLKPMFYLNLLFKFMWTWVRFPFSRRTGYVLILQKES